MYIWINNQSYGMVEQNCNCDCECCVDSCCDGCGCEGCECC